MSSPASALLSWLLMGVLALGVGFVGLAWPDDEVWEKFEAVLAAAGAPTTQPQRGGSGIPAAPKDDGAKAGTDAANETEAALGDTDGDTDGEVLDTLVPVEPVPELMDPETLLDQLPAEGPAPRKKSKKIVVGDARVEVVEGEADWLVHVVTPTETPDQIAYRYGVRPDSLRMWNGIKAETDKLRPGTRLKLHPRKVPPRRQVHEYYVQPGDTWWSIGTMFGIDSRDLRATNAGVAQRLVSGTPIEIWLDPIVYMWVSGETDANVPAGIRLGAVGIGTPQSGRLVNGVQLPPNESYTLKLPPSAYGTTHAVAHVVRAMEQFRERSTYRSPFMMGSMSSMHGGPLSGHKSHQSGRDLDIRLPMLESLQQHIPVTPKRIDWEALWHLMEAFDATGQVVVIFLDYEIQKLLHEAVVAMDVSEERLDRILQYPHGIKANLGLVRHSPGHEAHIHVRMTCGPSEPECVSEADFDIDAE